MRTPFQMPAGCPTISVDINILGSMPFCSIPAMTVAEVALHPLEISPPDIAPPPVFACLSIDVEVNHLGPGAFQASFVNMASHAGVKDCGDPQYQLRLSLAVPCMPLSVAAHNYVSIVDTAAYLHVSMARGATTGSQCGLSTTVSLQIPCMPMLLSMEKHIAATNAPASISAAVYKVGLPDTCHVKTYISVNVPCVPTLGPGVNIAGTGGGGGHYALQMNLTGGDSCVLDLAGTLAIDFPAVGGHPCALSASKLLTMPSMIYPYGIFSAHFSHRFSTVSHPCADVLKMSLQIPCTPAIGGGYLFPPTLPRGCNGIIKGHIQLKSTGCTLSIVPTNLGVSCPTSRGVCSVVMLLSGGALAAGEFWSPKAIRTGSMGCTRVIVFGHSCMTF